MDPRNTLYKKLGPDSAAIVLNVDPAVSIKEGQPCWFDKATGLAKPIGPTISNAQLAMYCGIAQSTIPVTHFPRQKNQMSFYIGDCVVKLEVDGVEAIDYLTPMFPGAAAGTITSVAGLWTVNLGHVYIEADEFKAPRNTAALEEIAIIMRDSIFKSKVF